MDLRKYRLHARSAQAARFRLRLGARARDLQAGILPLGAVAVHAPVRERPCVQENGCGELVPERPDRARERAGGGRQVLALRHHGGTPGNRAMVHENHRLCRGTARRYRPPRWLAGAGAHDAAQLDRPLRRRADGVRRRRRRTADRLHHAPGYPDGRHLRGRGH